MYLVRDVFHCKPGKVRPLVEKFRQMGEVMKKLNLAGRNPRFLTDVSGDRYWTVISEMEVDALDPFFQMDDKAMAAAGADKIMAGYHDLVESGHREIYKIEA